MTQRNPADILDEGLNEDEDESLRGRTENNDAGGGGIEEQGIVNENKEEGAGKEVPNFESNATSAKNIDEQGQASKEGQGEKKQEGNSSEQTSPSDAAASSSPPSSTSENEKLEKMERQRKEVLKEILKTEQTYVTSLKFMNDVCFQAKFIGEERGKCIENQDGERRAEINFISLSQNFLFFFFFPFFSRYLFPFF